MHAVRSSSTPPFVLIPRRRFWRLERRTTTSPPTNRFTRLLAERDWLLADGATGSNLFDMGLMSGDAPELWNTEHPDRITRLHQSFVEAGADIILTNSFGGTTYRLKLHNAQSRMAELNTAARASPAAWPTPADAPW